jgi:hypothetical protein
MSTEPRRLAVVSAAHSAAGAAPPGIDPAAFADACLADAYEVLADLIDVGSAIAGPDSVAELLWPGSRRLPADRSIAQLADLLRDEVDELVVIPADAPDLPGLVLAKIFKVLHRVDVAIAPQRGGSGCVAIGVAVPLADWIDPDLLDLDGQPHAQLAADRSRRTRWSLAPDWHRLRSPADVHRLDPGLEGWEQTRALLSGHSLAGG